MKGAPVLPVLPRTSEACASQAHVPFTAAGARRPSHPPAVKVIATDPVAPGPLQLNVTPAIADSSETDTTIGGPDSPGQDNDDVAPTIDTIGSCSTDAMIVSGAVPVALLPAATWRPRSSPRR